MKNNLREILPLMRLKHYPDRHLTYCSNIHPGENWEEHFSQLKIHLPQLKERLSPGEPFGVGLRLSAAAASQLLSGDRLDRFAGWLKNEDLYVFTLNGFPYGNFHGRKVKDRVYRPDWRTAGRLSYTLDLVRILAELLPEGLDGGISTSPLSYKYWSGGGAGVQKVFEQSCRHLAEVAYEMSRVESRLGKELHLDIEPEPDCLLENSRETVDFFSSRLIPDGGAILADLHGLSRAEGRRLIRRHIGVCYDTCHFAVEYEEPREAVRRICRAGIRIGKTQISAALRVGLDGEMERRAELAGRLRDFDESTYLHQVVERRNDDSLLQYRDLSQALDNIVNPGAVEWRIHFHVPVFVARFEGLQSTRDHIPAALGPLLEESGCRHFEIETYTWGVLPEGLKTELTGSIEREYRWTLEQFEPAGGRHA